MNVDRVLRDVEARLAGLDFLDETLREDVLDIVREIFARERRHLGPTLTVEAERERRQTAEELRQALEAIHQSTRPEEALVEILTQLGRVVAVDYAAVVATEPGGAFRLLATRGDESEQDLAGASLSGPHLDLVRETKRPVNIGDAVAQEAPIPAPGAPEVRTWVALPLLLEGEVVGVLLSGRKAPDPFTDDEMLRMRAVAFWASATLRRGQQIEQVRRYAALLEQVSAVDETVFDGASPDRVGQAILAGACKVGSYRGGLLVLQTPHGPVVGAAQGEAFAAATGRPAPVELAATVTRRLSAERMLEVAEALGTQLPAEQTYLVPLATPDRYIGCLVLLDPNGESPDDRLLESFGPRAAAALRFAAEHDARDRPA